MASSLKDIAKFELPSCKAGQNFDDHMILKKQQIMHWCVPFPDFKKQ